jgi:AcrR family transcriptional regulator
MARRNIRRTPRQERAQATVDAVIEAGARILVEDGYGPLSTNRIAKRAGVSVGTLYQYFPDKEAIVEALIERLVAEQIEAFRQVVLRVTAQQPSLEDGVRAMVDGTLAALRVRPELSRVLILEVPRGGKLDVEREWKDRCTDLVRMMLYEKPQNRRSGDAGLMASVLVTGVFGVLRDAIAFRPELLLGDALRDEICALAVRYLRPD